jgi:hypothetical protein
MVKELENYDEDIERIIKQVASEYEYLNRFVKDLEKVREDLNDPDKLKGDIRKSFKDFRYGSRSERKVESFEEKLEEHAKELMKMLPEKLKSEINDVDEKVRRAAEKLLTEASFHEGKIRTRLNNLILLVEKLRDEKKDKTPDIKKVQYYKDTINKRIQQLISRIQSTINWTRALAINLKEAESEAKKLERLAS